MRLIVLGLLLFGLSCQARNWKDNSGSFESDSFESESFESEEHLDRLKKTIEERKKLVRGGNDEGEGRDKYFSYKSVCMINGKPQLADMFECRNQVAVGRWQNAINSTG